MLRYALATVLAVFCIACGGEDADPPAMGEPDVDADPCPPVAQDVIERALEFGAASLHTADDWTMEKPYTPAACDIDCDDIPGDRFVFEAPEAGVYRFTSDFGDLYGGGVCGESAIDEFGGFPFANRRQLDVELEAGETTLVTAFMWADIDAAFETFPEMYQVRVAPLGE